LATARDVVRVAESKVGYVERGGSDGHSGNITEFWAELDPGLQGQPWCACFIRWTDKHAHGPVLPISNPYYCPSIVTYARQHGLWNPRGHKAKAGDYVLFDFEGHGVAEHIGRLRRDWDGHSNALTVEGNTSSGNYGSQANGGGVYNRVREASLILGTVSYTSLLSKKVGPVPVRKQKQAPRNGIKRNPFRTPSRNVHEGQTGDQVRFVQWAVGVPVDGVFGAQTVTAVKLFQRYHPACGAVDGVVGTKTRVVLAKVTH
jgi:hypothetical protein